MPWGIIIKMDLLYIYLGCTIEFLKKHLESKFQPGMSWENRGNGT